MSVRTNTAAIGVLRGYAARVRNGETVPHPRHWAVLWNLQGAIPLGAHD